LRIAFVYPPLAGPGRFPLLGQNRQFRYSSSSHVRLYPLVPASAVTLLDRAGFESTLIDGINARMTQRQFATELDRFSPEMIVMEAKTPIMPVLWKLADTYRCEFGPVVLVGDHVTARPQESLLRSRADYVVTGGDYDLSILNLARHLESQSRSHTDDLPGGIWHLVDGKPRCNGPAPMWRDLDEIPFIDRELTRWELYGEAYLNRPSTYIMTGRGCGGDGRAPGRCSFCSWQHLFWRQQCRTRSPGNVADEVQHIVERQKPKEIFDDNESGMTWSPSWLEAFKLELEKRGILGEVMLSSNSRADSLTRETCNLLSKIGFRLLKIGIESGSQSTLDRICKMETLTAMEAGVRNAKDAGLRVLLTVMVGYPWEGVKEVRATLRFVRRLLRYKARIGDSLQASILIPYPGTPLHDMALRDNLFAVDPADYEAYDMSRPVLRSPLQPEGWCRRLWMLHLDPVFLSRCLLSIRSIDQVKLATTGVRSLICHVSDFAEPNRGGTLAPD